MNWRSLWPWGKQRVRLPDHVNDGPAGAAQFDPRQQTHRADMPDDQRNGRGVPSRGNLPPGALPEQQHGEAAPSDAGRQGARG